MLARNNNDLKFKSMTHFSTTITIVNYVSKISTIIKYYETFNLH